MTSVRHCRQRGHADLGPVFARETGHAVPHRSGENVHQGRANVEGTDFKRTEETEARISRIAQISPVGIYVNLELKPEAGEILVELS